jgi:hypothetical protein
MKAAADQHVIARLNRCNPLTGRDYVPDVLPMSQDSINLR